MRKALRFLLVLVVLFVGFAEVSHAGAFVLDHLSYTTWFDSLGFFVGVIGSATYTGTLDPTDRHWSINTRLEFHPGPDFAGRGKSGTSIPGSGYTIWCHLDNGCAGNGDIIRPECPIRVFYLGWGVVTIFHTGKDETDYRYGPTYLVPCKNCPPEDPGPGQGGPPL